MNDKTDYPLMEQLRKVMKYSDKAKNLKGKYEPEEIAKVTSKTSLVISSRLHLLILASISYIPIIGLSRGSKIDRFLKEFDEQTPGSVESFDTERLELLCEEHLKKSDEFSKKSIKIVNKLQSRAGENIHLINEICKNN